MKKNIFRLIFCLLSLVPSLASLSQPPVDNYYYLKFPGDIVKKTLRIPNFSFFDFTFHQLPDGNYILTGWAKDANNNKLGDSITLLQIAHPPARPLRNIEKGRLYLRLKTMQDRGVDGSEDYILSPQKCKDRNGHEVDYVSYYFSNRPALKRGRKPKAVRAFDLNPSPPYS